VVKRLPDEFLEILYLKYITPGNEMAKRKAFCQKHKCGTSRYDQQVDRLHHVVSGAVAILELG
jgi:hypothetical protein